MSTTKHAVLFFAILAVALYGQIQTTTQQQVRKVQLSLAEQQVIQVPVGAKALSVDFSAGQPFLYLCVDPAVTALTTKMVKVEPTDRAFTNTPAIPMQYVGKLPAAEYHVFIQQ